MLISSNRNPAIRLIRSLREKKGRQENGLFLAEGRKVLARARKEGWAAEYLLLGKGEEPEGFETAKVIAVTEDILSAVSAQANPPDAIAVFRQNMGGGLARPTFTTCGSGSIQSAIPAISGPSSGRWTPQGERCRSHRTNVRSMVARVRARHHGIDLRGSARQTE